MQNGDVGPRGAGLDPQPTVAAVSDAVGAAHGVEYVERAAGEPGTLAGRLPGPEAHFAQLVGRARVIDARVLVLDTRWRVDHAERGGPYEVHVMTWNAIRI